MQYDLLPNIIKYFSSKSKRSFILGSTLKLVLFVGFFLGYSDFPYIMKADIFKFKNTTDNPIAMVTSLSAEYFWFLGYFS